MLRRAVLDGADDGSVDDSGLRWTKFNNLPNVRLREAQFQIPDVEVGAVPESEALPLVAPPPPLVAAAGPGIETAQRNVKKMIGRQEKIHSVGWEDIVM